MNLIESLKSMKTISVLIPPEISGQMQPDTSRWYDWLELPAECETMDKAKEFDRMACAVGKTLFLRRINAAELEAWRATSGEDGKVPPPNAILVRALSATSRTRHAVRTRDGAQKPHLN